MTIEIPQPAKLAYSMGLHAAFVFISILMTPIVILLLVQFLGMPSVMCYMAPVLALGVAYLSWRLLSKPILELTPQGITTYSFSGRTSFLAWNEIATYEVKRIDGYIILQNQHATKNVKISFQVQAFELVVTIIAFQCPHLWQLQAERTFENKRKPFWLILVFSALFGVLTFAFNQKIGAVLCIFIVIANIVFYYDWRKVPTRLIVRENTIELTSVRGVEVTTFDAIKNIYAQGLENQGVTINFATMVILDEKTRVDVSAFDKDGLAVFGTILWAWLRYKGEKPEIIWHNHA